MTEKRLACKRSDERSFATGGAGGDGMEWRQESTGHQPPRDPIGENRGKIVMKIIEGAETQASIRVGDRLASASTNESPECVVLDSLCAFRGAAIPSAPDDEAV